MSEFCVTNESLGGHLSQTLLREDGSRHVAVNMQITYMCLNVYAGARKSRRGFQSLCRWRTGICETTDVGVGILRWVSIRTVHSQLLAKSPALQNNFYYIHLFIVSCNTYAMVFFWRSEDNLGESVLSFIYKGLCNWPQDVSLDIWLYLLYTHYTQGMFLNAFLGYLWRTTSEANHIIKETSEKAFVTVHGRMTSKASLSKVVRMGQSQNIFVDGMW